MLGYVIARACEKGPFCARFRRLPFIPESELATQYNISWI